jgi:aminocarboxymuconate-semialdehyde decarboxylase
LPDIRSSPRKNWDGSKNNNPAETDAASEVSHGRMKMVVDVFCHYFSKSVGEMIGKVRCQLEERASPAKWEEKFQYPRQSADPDVRLGLMDKYGIQVQALSLSAETLRGFNAEGAAEICQLANNDNYAVCRAYPDRFVNICIVSLLDMKSAMRELDRSINELDCRAITVASNQNGKGLDSPEYFPFYEKLAEYDLPLFIHPTHWGSYPLVDDRDGWEIISIFGWPFDSTVAVWRLIFGGVLDRFPSLKVVMHHMGAMFPYFAGRVEAGSQKLSKKLSRQMSEYWSHIYGDTAISGGFSEAYSCGYAFFGPDRLMYGSDYPFGPEAGEKFVRSILAATRLIHAPEDHLEKILSGNARKLLKIG